MCLIPHAPLSKDACCFCVCASFAIFFAVLPPLPSPPPPSCRFLPALLLHIFSHQRLTFALSSDCVSSDVFLNHPLLFLIYQNIRKNLQTKTCPELCCLPLKKNPSVTAENHGMNGVRTINMLHWTRNDIPFRILPSQYAKRRHCTNNIQECQSRDLTTARKNAKATVVT